MKVARIYLRVSTDEQNLARQENIERDTRTAGYHIAGNYLKKPPAFVQIIDVGGRSLVWGS